MAKSEACTIAPLSPFAPAKGVPASVEQSDVDGHVPGHAMDDRPGRARPANRKLGVERGEASVEVSDRSVGHRIERI
jgi:hypothetical protein